VEKKSAALAEEAEDKCPFLQARLSVAGRYAFEVSNLVAGKWFEPRAVDVHHGGLWTSPALVPAS
jgi:hypothetical protein